LKGDEAMNSIFPSKIALSILSKNTAYLDPGSGSFILQLILAALLSRRKGGK